MNTEKKAITTTKAPGAIGPYSQGVKAGNMIFVSGQLPINPADGLLVTSDIAKAAAQSMENLKAILEEAGSSLDKLVKTTIFVKDLNDFAAVNQVYTSYFTGNYPARSCVEVARLPMNALVEIEGIALA